MLNLALALMLWSAPQVVVEMDDGVRELRIGGKEVRVEVRNRGEDPAEPGPPRPGQRVFTDEEIESERFCDSWD